MELAEQIRRKFENNRAIVWFSKTPRPYINRDASLDVARQVITVYLAGEITWRGKPSHIDGHPVQYITPSWRDSKVKPPSLPGDSGSLVRSEDGRVVGLLWAGIPKLGLSYVCKASLIEQILDVSFAPPQGQRPPKRKYHKVDNLPKDPRHRFDVLVGGISIGHRDVGAGTLGGFVWDKRTKEILGITAGHVAGPAGVAQQGDPIYQPGPLDIFSRWGRKPADDDIAGYLLRWSEPKPNEANLIDAAVFRLARPSLPYYSLGLGWVL